MRARPYIRHYHNEAQDLRIRELRARFGPEGYGIYWLLLEEMAMAGGFIQRVNFLAFSRSFGYPCDKLTELVDFCLTFELKGKHTLFQEYEQGIGESRILRAKLFAEARSECGRHYGRLRFPKNRDKEVETK